MEQNTDAGASVAPVVDNKQKGGNGLKIATVVACVVAVCGVGFGVYGMMQSFEKDGQISDLKTQIEDSEKSATNIDSLDPVATMDIYENFANNLAKNYDNMIITGHYYHWTGSDNVERTVAARVENSHLTIIDDVNAGNAVIAEVDDIISVYYVEVGNGSVPYIYMIRKDGSVARIDISEDARVIENLDGYGKIVSIFGGGDLYAHLIDVNGNIYKNS